MFVLNYLELLILHPPFSATVVAETRLACMTSPTKSPTSTKHVSCTWSEHTYHEDDSVMGCY
jgi:hypothetical protein